VPNDESIEKQGYNFTSMMDIQNANRIMVIDFIGVLFGVGEVFEIQLKNGQMKGKRNIKVVDESGMEIEVHIWAPAAHKFDNLEGENPVVAFKSARIVEF